MYNRKNRSDEAGVYPKNGRRRQSTHGRTDANRGDVR